MMFMIIVDAAELGKTLGGKPIAFMCG